MRKEERQELVKLIHLTYNEVVDDNEQLAKQLIQDYLRIEEKDENYKIVASDMQRYLNQTLLRQKNKSSSLVKLAKLVDKISNFYASFSVTNIWF